MALVAILLVAHTPPAFATSCVTMALDVRQANVVAVARYAGNGVFSVESILRTLGDSPSKLVAPEDWRSSPCSNPEPEPGQSYVVVLYASGTLRYRAYEQTAYERALIEKLHAVSAESILDALQSYSNGSMNRDQIHDWLLSGVVEPRPEDSFTHELLDAAETLLNRIAVSEACHKDLVHSLRTKELPAALRTLARRVPTVDTKEEFVRRRVDPINDAAQKAANEDLALDEWDDTLAAIDDALGPLEAKLRALPWCDHEKYGW